MTSGPIIATIIRAHSPAIFIGSTVANPAITYANKLSVVVARGAKQSDRSGVVPDRTASTNHAIIAGATHQRNAAERRLRVAAGVNNGAPARIAQMA